MRVHGAVVLAACLALLLALPPPQVARAQGCPGLPCRACNFDPTTGRCVAGSCSGGQKCGCPLGQRCVLIATNRCACGPAPLPASGQTTAYTADKNDGIPGPVPVPDDGTVRAGGGLTYVDNGDGTITDQNTGLMWEKKTGGFGASVHDQGGNAYVWSGDGSQQTIWDWLDLVNAEGGTGFAGHNDWRIPNVKELQSIINYENSSPAVSPAFNTNCTYLCTECSCTVSLPYWSSTTYAPIAAEKAWAVDFYDGRLVPNLKTGPGAVLEVRAVRGP